MSFLKIPFASSLTGWGCQRTLWSADTTLLLVLEGFYSEKLQKNSFDHSTKTLISDHCWFGDLGGSCSAESLLLWSSWAQAGIPGSGSWDWHLIVTPAPSTSCPIHFDSLQCLRNFQTRQNENLPSPAVHPHHKDTCWTVSKNGTPFGRAKKTTH